MDFEENHNHELKINDGTDLDLGEETVEHKNITIRGINAEIYSEFSKKIKSLDMNIGDALSKMMTDINKDFDDTFPQISSKSLKVKARLYIEHYNELSVNKNDLEESGGRVIFQHIKHLTLEADVTKEVFLEYVGRIQHCQVVKIPSSIPKLLAYSKIQFGNEIEIYDVTDQI